MSTSPLIKYVLPAAAVGLVGFAVVSSNRPPREQTEPLLAAPTSPYQGKVAGIGVVEPSSELIEVAAELSGVVRDVAVAPGAQVKRGAPLFRLDDRALRAQLEAAQAEAAQAEAALAAARVTLADEEQRLGLFQAVEDKRAISEDELKRREFAVRRAETAVVQAEAAARAARAQARVVATDLDRLTVRAPIDGVVWRVNVRPGEFAQAGPAAEPLVTVGASETLHVRVEIDEADINRVQPGAQAVGAYRGDAANTIPLRFVRFEPEAVEKRALSGGAERVDTRVIEALYAFEPGVGPTFIGQRMDVFIEARPLMVRKAGEGEPS